MDQIRIGKFIAALRKEKGMMQEQLGEKLGATNKTISRWEKGNYDTNYCDRIAEGETRNCQDLAAQENYKKKMADNAAIPLYQKYYKRYAARVRVRQIKEPDFKKWKYQAMTKRDECSDGKITLAEFEEWLEGSFPNRKKKE